MKAYGLNGRDCLEDFGPPTRDRNHKSKERKRSRRLLHKAGRREGQKVVKSAVRELALT